MPAALPSTRTPLQKEQDAKRSREYRRRQAQKKKAVKEEEEYLLREEFRKNQEELYSNEALCKKLYGE